MVSNTCTAVPVEWVVYVVGSAVALAVLSPKDWHDASLDLVRKRFGVGPGGSATDDQEDRADE